MSEALAVPAEPDVAPAALTEQLMGVWTRILQVSALTPDSDFFELGGDSLLGVNLLLEVEREIGVKLPITTLYDAPTIAALAALIASETTPPFSPLVLLKVGEGRAPLFIVHGIGGTVVELTVLARKIRIREPVYALQARGLDGAEPPLDSVAAMAGLYLDAIRQVQPAGPYWLCGYSFGGLVALEMARRLKAEHQETALLILMDAYAHPETWPVLSRIKMRARRMMHRIGQADALTILFHHAASILSRVPVRGRRSRVSRSIRLRRWLRDHNPDLPLPLLQVREAGDAALSSYTPDYYPGKITFLKAARRTAEFPDDPERIWRPLVEEMELHIIPGGHRSIVSEHADAAAARITACVVETRFDRRREAVARAGSSVVAVARDRRLNTEAV